MRIYIIGTDGITLSREPPAAVSEGEIVVASNEELHAAALNSRRLLALWNALPDVEKRRKVGDRDALIAEACVSVVGDRVSFVVEKRRTQGRWRNRATRLSDRKRGTHRMALR
jgi:hypothetical protein